MPLICIHVFLREKNIFYHNTIVSRISYVLFTTEAFRALLTVVTIVNIIMVHCIVKLLTKIILTKAPAIYWCPVWTSRSKMLTLQQNSGAV